MLVKNPNILILTKIKSLVQNPKIWPISWRKITSDEPWRVRVKPQNKFARKPKINRLPFLSVHSNYRNIYIFRNQKKCATFLHPILYCKNKKWKIRFWFWHILLLRYYFIDFFFEFICGQKCNVFGKIF